MTAFDVMVLGAGPAGGHAALAAAGAGLRVALIDEQAAAGGQVWRLGSAGRAEAAEAREGGRLRERLANSAVSFLPGRRIWSIGGGYRADMVGPAGSESVEAPRLIAATGAHERVVPFPGWTLPGVIGLAAATVLLKAEAIVPGRRVVVAGCGPLLALVASGIVKAGGQVVAVADLAGPADWLAALPSLLPRPSQLVRGVGWMLTLGTARVPVLFRHGVRRAEGAMQVERVVLAPVDREGGWRGGDERAFDADALAVGHGLVPGAEVPRLLRAALRFDRALGGWVPVLDPAGRTSIAGLYAAGDGAGLRGAAVAALSGSLAGLAAAYDAGRLDAAGFDARRAPLAAKAKRVAAMAASMAAMMTLRQAQVASIPRETVICRCEDVTRAEIEAAARAGACELNQLKQFTRCGMGPCQGRFCGDVAAELLAQTLAVPREEVGLWTARPPLRPVALSDLMGRFAYSDIPIPAPAPL